MNMALQGALVASIVGTRPTPDDAAESSALRPIPTIAQRALGRFGALKPYNLTIGRDPRFVWYRVAKVGTRSILDAIDVAGTSLVAEHAYQVRLPPALIRDYFRFAFVRDPRDRFVSCWRNKVVESNLYNLDEQTRTRLSDFSEFVEFVEQTSWIKWDPHLKRQTELIDRDNLDFLGRMENFEADLRSVLRQLGLPAEIPHRNKSAGSAPDVFTTGLRERVDRLYAADLEAFSY